MFLLRLCSVFSLMFLHFFLYGCNIFAWRKTRINYKFIFEIAPTKELKYRDVFLICTMSMTVVVGVLFFHLTLLTKGYTYAQVQILLGLLFLVSSRFFTLHQIHYYEFKKCASNTINKFYTIIQSYIISV